MKALRYFIYFAFALIPMAIVDLTMGEFPIRQPSHHVWFDFDGAVTRSLVVEGNRLELHLEGLALLYGLLSLEGLLFSLIEKRGIGNTRLMTYGGISSHIWWSLIYPTSVVALIVAVVWFNP